MRAEENGRHYTDYIFQRIFRKNISLYWFKFHQLFLRIRLTVNQHWVSNDLALNRRQAITWSNAGGIDDDIWRHQATVSFTAIRLPAFKVAGDNIWDTRSYPFSCNSERFVN